MKADAQIINDCTYCKGKGKIPTDIWNESTSAMFEPCLKCSRDDRDRFYESTEYDRLLWFLNE